MLQKKVIDGKTFSLLKKLQAIPEFSNLRLVGGTALALQFGHRISVDLDLFGVFDSSFPLEMLLNGFDHVEKTGANRFMQFFEIDGVKVDFVNYDYPWLRDAVSEESIVLASTEDIAAMKVNAIINRGTRKDFVDMFFLLQKYTLHDILSLYMKKYGVADYQLALRSLVYFDDAESEIMPRMLVDASWDTVKSEIISQVQKFK